MATYIFFWNPDISNVTKERFNDEYFNNGGFFNWSINEYEHVAEGDDFYMVVCGPINAVVAKGVIQSEAYQAQDWSPKKRKPIYYVDLETYVAVNPFYTDNLLTADELTKAMPDFNWFGGHSGRLLRADYAETLDEMFKSYITSNPMLIEEGAAWDDEWNTGEED